MITCMYLFFKESMELLISYKEGPFLPAAFPVSVSLEVPLHYHVADVSPDGQVKTEKEWCGHHTRNNLRFSL